MIIIVSVFLLAFKDNWLNDSKINNTSYVSFCNAYYLHSSNEAPKKAYMFYCFKKY